MKIDSLLLSFHKLNLLVAQLPELLEKIIDLNLLKKNGIFIIHRHKKENEKFTKKFNILVKKNYGISKIIFGNQNLY